MNGLCDRHHTKEFQEKALKALKFSWIKQEKKEQPTQFAIEFDLSDFSVIYKLLLERTSSLVRKEALNWKRGKYPMTMNLNLKLWFQMSKEGFEIILKYNCQVVNT